MIPCPYCNDDRAAQPNCYCRAMKPLVWDASDIADSDAELTPDEQRLFERNMAMMEAMEAYEEKLLGRPTVH